MFHSLADVILAKNFVKICQNQWNNMKKALNDERDIMIWCLTYINTLAKLQETSGKNTNWKKTTMIWTHIIMHVTYEKKIVKLCQNQ